LCRRRWMVLASFVSPRRTRLSFTLLGELEGFFGEDPGVTQQLMKAADPLP